MKEEYTRYGVQMHDALNAVRYAESSAFASASKLASAGSKRALLRHLADMCNWSCAVNAHRNRQRPPACDHSLCEWTCFQAESETAEELSVSMSSVKRCRDALIAGEWICASADKPGRGAIWTYIINRTKLFEAARAGKQKGSNLPPFCVSDEKEKGSNLHENGSNLHEKGSRLPEHIRKNRNEPYMNQKNPPTPQGGLQANAALSVPNTRPRRETARDRRIREWAMIGASTASPATVVSQAVFRVEAACPVATEHAEVSEELKSVSEAGAQPMDEPLIECDLSVTGAMNAVHKAQTSLCESTVRPRRESPREGQYRECSAVGWDIGKRPRVASEYSPEQVLQALKAALALARRKIIEFETRAQKAIPGTVGMVKEWDEAFQSIEYAGHLPNDKPSSSMVIRILSPSEQRTSAVMEDRQARLDEALRAAFGFRVVLEVHGKPEHLAA